MEFVVFLWCCLLTGWCFVLHKKLQDAESRIDTLLRRDVVSPAHVNTLEERIWRPEYPVAPPPPSVSQPQPEQPQPFAPPAISSPVATTTAAERLRAVLGNEEWEALLGGNILNKAGAVVLVIGIALTLAYSFAHVGAAGRALFALLASLGILALGVVTERRDRYRVFARGLIGAGWAGLYATAYAAYAIPAAQVIDDPFIGSFGLLLVAAGMIGHSLRYRAQAVTATAYFAAFAALAATPSTPFAVVSLVPLAVSLLYLAARFNWNAMALFGLAATYGTCIARGSSGAPLAQVEALFLTYWLLFEGFDFLRMKRRTFDRLTDLIYPLNLIGFLGLSYALWSDRTPERLWLASALAAGLFFADAMVRAYLRPPASFEPGEALAARLSAGSYEGSLIVSAVLAGLAIVGRVQGVWSGAALAVEAELVYLAGIRFNSAFVRRAGAAGFAWSLTRTALADTAATTQLLGVTLRNISPTLLFHSALFYLNRAIRRPNAIMSWAAALLVAIVIAIEASDTFVGSWWALLGMLLLLTGLRFRTADFRWQAYTLLAAATLQTSFQTDWRALAATLSAIYMCAAGERWVGESSVGIQERRYVGLAASGAACMLAAILVWRAAPVDYAGLAECGLALVVLAAGLARFPEPLRLGYGPIALVAAFVLMSTHDLDFAKFPAHAVWISYAGAALAAWIGGAIWTVGARAGELPGERPLMQHGTLTLATLATVAAVWLVTPDPFVCAVWIAITLLLLIAGIRIPATAVRVQSCIGGALVLTWAFIYDIEPARLLPSALAALGLYLAQFLARSADERNAPVFFSILATLLTTAILYGEVSGGMLTTSWGLEGLALLGAGFFARDRILRLQGLALLLVCILKVFFYDLRNLETIYRILSFIALGLILLAVSWIYTRFREHIQRLL